MHTHPGRGRRRTDSKLKAIVAAIACGLALTACGGGGGASDEDQVRELVEQISSNDPAACDNFTKDFLEERDVTTKDCEEAANEEDSGVKPTVEEVSVDGETATAVVLDEDRSTLKLVKQDDEWLVDSIDVEEGAGKSGSSGEEGEPEEAEAPAGGGEVEAQAAVDAFLIGVRDEDPQVLCGLLSERYAKKLTGVREFGIAECVEELQGSSFARLQKVLKGVEPTDTTVAADGRSATVKLSNGNTVRLKYQDGRFVIDQL